MQTLTHRRDLLEDVVDRQALLPKGPALHNAVVLVGSTKQHLKNRVPRHKCHNREDTALVIPTLHVQARACTQVMLHQQKSRESNQ